MPSWRSTQRRRTTVPCSSPSHSPRSRSPRNWLRLRSPMQRVISDFFGSPPIAAFPEHVSIQIPTNSFDSSGPHWGRGGFILSGVPPPPLPLLVILTSLLTPENLMWTTWSSSQRFCAHFEWQFVPAGTSISAGGNSTAPGKRPEAPTQGERHVVAGAIA